MDERSSIINIFLTFPITPLLRLAFLRHNCYLSLVHITKNNEPSFPILFSTHQFIFCKHINQQHQPHNMLCALHAAFLEDINIRYNIFSMQCLRMSLRVEFFFYIAYILLLFFTCTYAPYLPPSSSSFTNNCCCVLFATIAAVEVVLARQQPCTWCTSGRFGLTEWVSSLFKKISMYKKMKENSCLCVKNELVCSFTCVLFLPLSGN